MKSWWTEVGLRRLREGRDGLYSFNVFNVSRPDFMRIQELHRAYFRNLRAIVARSSPAELVAVANVHLFALDEPTIALR